MQVEEPTIARLCSMFRGKAGLLEEVVVGVVFGAVLPLRLPRPRALFQYNSVLL